MKFNALAVLIKREREKCLEWIGLLRCMVYGVRCAAGERRNSWLLVA